MLLSLRYAKFAKKRPLTHKIVISSILVTTIISMVVILAEEDLRAFIPLLLSALTIPFFARSSNLKKQLPD